MELHCGSDSSGYIFGDRPVEAVDPHQPAI